MEVWFKIKLGADCLVDYFTNFANDIGDPHTLPQLTEEELTDHESAQRILAK